MTKRNLLPVLDRVVNKTVFQQSETSFQKSTRTEYYKVLLLASAVCMILGLLGLVNATRQV